jgi:hypothetical protein
MWPTLAILGLMFFTWIVAMYATNSETNTEEATQKPLASSESEKDERAA